MIVPPLFVFSRFSQRSELFSVQNFACGLSKNSPDHPRINFEPEQTYDL